MKFLVFCSVCATYVRRRVPLELEFVTLYGFHILPLTVLDEMQNNDERKNV